MTGEISRSLGMNFGSITGHFLLVKTSFPVGSAVGINFEDFREQKILASKCNTIQRLGCFRILKKGKERKGKELYLSV